MGSTSGQTVASRPGSTTRGVWVSSTQQSRLLWRSHGVCFQRRLSRRFLAQQAGTHKMLQRHLRFQGSSSGQTTCWASAYECGGITTKVERAHLNVCPPLLWYHDSSDALTYPSTTVWYYGTVKHFDKWNIRGECYKIKYDDGYEDNYALDKVLLDPTYHDPMRFDFASRLSPSCSWATVSSGIERLRLTSNALALSPPLAMRLTAEMTVGDGEGGGGEEGDDSVACDQTAEELVGKEVQIFWQVPCGWFDAKINSWRWGKDENGTRVRLHEVSIMLAP